MERNSGVLLNVSSLPGEFGIGVLSHNAEMIIVEIANSGFSWWQVLPVTTIGAGNSPYSGDSTFAGNYLYINPYSLHKKGLITDEELRDAKYRGAPYQTDYDFARWNMSKLLNKAFTRINDEIKARIAKFAEDNKYWLDDYALFESIAEECGFDWTKWDAGLKNREPKALQAAREKYAERIAFYEFVQYEFYREWFKLKAFANDKGVSILGDLPFYVSLQSADVWSHRELFVLKSDGSPDGVAGVPPDYFSASGQIWNNPIFDFAAMKKNDYAWWRARVSHCLKLYDGLRLDHFRAFSRYYVISTKNDPLDAHDGEWRECPGKELITFFKNDNPAALFVAEDLGIIDDAVKELVEWSGFPAMKVLQFAFESFDSDHLPHKYCQNTVAYTGTHDNNTTLGWLYDVAPEVRDYALDYCNMPGSGGWGSGGPQCPSTRAMIRTLMSSCANLVVFPIQDLAGYGSDTRMNVPGVAEGNWRFRTHYDMLMSLDRQWLLKMNNLFGRNVK